MRGISDCEAIFVVDKYDGNWCLFVGKSVPGLLEVVRVSECITEAGVPIVYYDVELAPDCDLFKINTVASWTKDCSWSRLIKSFKRNAVPLLQFHGMTRSNIWHNKTGQLHIDTKHVVDFLRMILPTPQLEALDAELAKTKVEEEA